MIGLLALSGISCRRSEPAEIGAVPANQPYLDHAQPRLSTIKLWLGSQELVAEVARTQTEVATGMMFRKEMNENEAMLFVFAQPFHASFYMRNTIIPLSCAYLDTEGEILEIHDLKPRDETPIEAASANVRYVLETKQGWFDRNKIGVGTLVRAEAGSLTETFFGR
jgi:uncharacterized membrane protein (UPF0127 family)